MHIKEIEYIKRCSRRKNYFCLATMPHRAAITTTGIAIRFPISMPLLPSRKLFADDAVLISAEIAHMWRGSQVAMPGKMMNRANPIKARII